MVLPKYFLFTARKILILPKSSKLRGAIALPAPPVGTAMIQLKYLHVKKIVPEACDSVKQYNFDGFKDNLYYNINALQLVTRNRAPSLEGILVVCFAK